MEDRFQIGVITSPHGVKGEVKVFPTTDDSKRFKNLKTVILDTGKEEKLLTVEGVKFFKKFVILKFKEINSMNDAETYRRMKLLVPREQAVPLEKDEYYVADLIDLKVVLEDGSEYGILKDVLETGANDVYVIELPEGKEVLLPAIKECVLNISMGERTMMIHLMKGLVD